MLLFLVLTGFHVPSALASELCAKDRASLLACIDSHSPALREARLGVDQARAQESAAAQWQNPALGFSSLSGSGSDGRYRETEVNLSVPIELSGKLQARRHSAEADTAGKQAELSAARARLRVATLLNLNRYRQAQHEGEVTKEAIQSFERLIKQYAARPRLSPEQEASLAVFRMALNEYQLKATALRNELSELSTFFRVHAGLEPKAVEALLPAAPETWPEPPRGADLARSPRVQMLTVGVQSAEAELNAARSLAWPTVSIGPSARWQTQSGLHSTMWGFNVGVPVPLFNANGAGKQAAAAGLALGQAARELGITVEQNNRRQAEEIYRQSVELVRASASHRELEATHRRIDRTFSGGLVPSALIIEAHRSYVELEKSRHERELSALKAYYEMHVIDGTIGEVSQ